MKSLFIYFLFVYIGGSELHKLSNLEILDLEDNSFNNSILSFVEGLPSLKILYLDYNRLEGLIDLKG
jgi:Leucine-rich repeat (LRR) protein